MTGRNTLETPPHGPLSEAEEIEGLRALRVAPDWQERLQQAEMVCKLVDQHLDYEAKSRLLEDSNDFRPEHLCPEQRIQLVSDLYGATR